MERSPLSADGGRPPQNGLGVGALLRASRLRVGEDLSEVSQMLRIRYPYLEAIEDGRYQELPGPAYAIGFIRGYAKYLGLDSDEVVRRFKAETAGIDDKPDLVFPVPIPESSIPGGAILFIGAVVAVVAYTGWYLSTTGDSLLIEPVSPPPESLVEVSPEPPPPHQGTATAADVARDAAGEATQPAEPVAVVVIPPRETPAADAPPADPGIGTETAPPAEPEMSGETETPAVESPPPAVETPPAVATAPPEDAAEEAAAPTAPPPAGETVPEVAPAIETASGEPVTVAPPEPVETAAGLPAVADGGRDEVPGGESEQAAAADAATAAGASPTEPPAVPEAVAAAADPEPLAAPPPPLPPEPPEEAAAEPPEAAGVAGQAEPQPQVAAVAPAAEPPVAAVPVGRVYGAEEGSYRILVRAKSSSWIQVRDDLANQLLLTRLLRPGDSYRVPDRPGLKLLTGNAGALEILVDGVTVPSIGPEGVVRRGIELDAERLLQGTAVSD